MASNTVASGHLNPPVKELCRYFLANACRFGEKCAYSHDRTSAQPNNICRFYLQGACSYGERCRYDHVRPKTKPFTVPPPPPPVVFDPPIDLRQDDFAWPQQVQSDLAQPANSVKTFSEPLSYASVCRLNNDGYASAIQLFPSQESYGTFEYQPLCPYAEKNGFCEIYQSGNVCPYLHGEICDLCEMPVLHPFDEKQRELHRSECLEKYQAECDEAFDIQRSEEKVCGICLETVWSRSGDTRFGILENCDHIFCLECIRKWRASSAYDNRVIKACPECRVKSDFVTPTKYWPENQERKKDLINAYKDNLRQIHCKLFNRGDGSCPFGSKCFYLHVDKNGHEVVLSSPRPLRRMNADGEVENYSNSLNVFMMMNRNDGSSFSEYELLFDDEDDPADVQYLVQTDNDSIIRHNESGVH